MINLDLKPSIQEPGGPSEVTEQPSLNEIVLAYYATRYGHLEPVYTRRRADTAAVAYWDALKRACGGAAVVTSIRKLRIRSKGRWRISFAALIAKTFRKHAARIVGNVCKSNAMFRHLAGGA